MSPRSPHAAGPSHDSPEASFSELSHLHEQEAEEEGFPRFNVQASEENPDILGPTIPETQIMAEPSDIWHVKEQSAKREEPQSGIEESVKYVTGEGKSLTDKSLEAMYVTTEDKTLTDKSLKAKYVMTEGKALKYMYVTAASKVIVDQPSESVVTTESKVIKDKLLVVGSVPGLGTGTNKLAENNNEGPTEVEPDDLGGNNTTEDIPQVEEWRPDLGGHNTTEDEPQVEELKPDLGGHNTTEDEPQVEELKPDLGGHNTTEDEPQVEELKPDLGGHNTTEDEPQVEELKPDLGGHNTTEDEPQVEELKPDLGGHNTTEDEPQVEELKPDLGGHNTTEDEPQVEELKPDLGGHTTTEDEPQVEELKPDLGGHNTTEDEPQVEELKPDLRGHNTTEDEPRVQHVRRWNIQNDTSYNQSYFDLDLDPEMARKVTIGKVCIMLNGTVVKDMEEGDCKSQDGLHYKYIPAKFRNNGTNTTHVYNTENYDERHYETATEEILRSDEDDQDEEINEAGGVGEETPWNIDTEGNATVNWNLINSSRILSKPLDQGMNTSGLIEVSSNPRSNPERNPPTGPAVGSYERQTHIDPKDNTSSLLSLPGQMVSETKQPSETSTFSVASTELPLGKASPATSLTFSVAGSSNGSSMNSSSASHVRLEKPRAQQSDGHSESPQGNANAGPEQTLQRDTSTSVRPKPPSDHIIYQGRPLNDTSAGSLANQTSDSTGSTPNDPASGKGHSRPAKPSGIRKQKIIITYESGRFPIWPNFMRVFQEYHGGFRVQYAVGGLSPEDKVFILPERAQTPILKLFHV